MNQQFSRTQFPNGGWQFHQPQTGWSAPSPKSSTFDQTVRLIIDMRKKNPAVTLKHNLSVDPTAVGNELEAFTRRRLGIPLPGPLPASVLMPGLGNQVVSAPNEIRKLALGTGLLLAWERSNQGPVDKPVADHRSAICAACPRNDLGKLEEWKRSQVGASVRAKTPRTASLVHPTKEADNLGLCLGTFCPTEQLCSMPMGLIAIRMGSRETAELDGKCWIRV